MAFLMSSVRAIMEKAGESTAKYAEETVGRAAGTGRMAPDKAARFARDAAGRVERMKAGRRFSGVNAPGGRYNQNAGGGRFWQGATQNKVEAGYSAQHSPIKRQYDQTARKARRARYQAAKQVDANYAKQEEAFQEKARITGRPVEEIRGEERRKFAAKRGQAPNERNIENPARTNRAERLLPSKDPTRSRRALKQQMATDEDGNLYPVGRARNRKKIVDPSDPESFKESGGRGNPVNAGRADLLDLLNMAAERPNVPLPESSKIKSAKDAIVGGAKVAKPVIDEVGKGIGKGALFGAKDLLGSLGNLAFPAAGAVVGGLYNFATYDSSKETDPYRQQNTLISRFKSAGEGAFKGALVGAGIPTLSGVLRGIGSTLVDEETRMAAEAYGQGGNLFTRFVGGMRAAGGAKTGNFGDLNNRVGQAIVDENPLMGFAAAKRAQPAVDAARKKVDEAAKLPGIEKFAKETREAFQAADPNAKDYDEMFEMADLAEQEFANAKKAAIAPEKAEKLKKQIVDPYDRGKALLDAVDKPQVSAEARTKIEAAAKKAGETTKPEDFIDSGRAMKNMAGLTMMNAGNTLATAAGTAVGGTYFGLKTAIRSYQENVVAPTKEGQKTVNEIFNDLNKLNGSRTADQEKLFEHVQKLKQQKKGDKLLNPFYQYDDAKPAVLGRETDTKISPTTSRNYATNIIGAGVVGAAFTGAAIGGINASAYGAPAGHPLNIIGNTQRNVASSRAQMEADAAQKVRMTRPSLIGLNDTEEGYFTNPNMKPTRPRHDPGMYNDDGNLVFALSALRRG